MFVSCYVYGPKDLSSICLTTVSLVHKIQTYSILLCYYSGTVGITAPTSNYDPALFVSCQSQIRHPTPPPDVVKNVVANPNNIYPTSPPQQRRSPTTLPTPPLPRTQTVTSQPAVNAYQLIDKALTNNNILFPSLMHFKKLKYSEINQLYQKLTGNLMAGKMKNESLIQYLIKQIASQITGFKSNPNFQPNMTSKSLESLIGRINHWRLNSSTTVNKQPLEVPDHHIDINTVQEVEIQESSPVIIPPHENR